MKSIVYILLAVFISSILMTSIPVSLFAGNQSIRIECADSMPASEQLNLSAKIIGDRLKDYGIEQFQINILEDEKSIEIKLQEKIDQNEIYGLFTSKGKLEFYETYKVKDFVTKLDEDDQLFRLLNIAHAENEMFYKRSDAILGYSTAQDKAKVDNYLQSGLFLYPDLLDVKLLWSAYQDNRNVYDLYVLHKFPQLTGEMVAGSYADTNSTDVNFVYIAFSTKGTEVWEKVTANNIGNPIAIVLDEVVYSAPVVMDVIKGGKCMITGNFSLKESKLLSSLINNAELPLNFEVVKY